MICFIAGNWVSSHRPYVNVTGPLWLFSDSMDEPLEDLLHAAAVMNIAAGTAVRTARRVTLDVTDAGAGAGD
jgi:hypothetical protein